MIRVCTKPLSHRPFDALDDVFHIGIGDIRAGGEAHPDLSASQIHNWLRERYDTLPTVNGKTVYNFVKYVPTAGGAALADIDYHIEYGIRRSIPFGFSSRSKILLPLIG